MDHWAWFCARILLPKARGSASGHPPFVLAPFQVEAFDPYGTKFVDLIERSDVACPSDPAYGLMVVTRPSETPDPDATLTALAAAKPAGIVLLHLVTD